MPLLPESVRQHPAHLAPFPPRYAQVSEAIADKMRALGAEVVRINDTYEVACAQCSADCDKHGWKLIQDGSSPGYEAVPKRIHSGYSLLAREMLEQLGALNKKGKVSPDRCPTHVLANAGVGGLAAGIGGYLWDTLKKDRPRFVCVEPTNADCCAIKSQRVAYDALVAAGGAKKKKPPREGFGAEGTIQVGLDCKEVSPLAWGVLETGANDFVAIGDEMIGPCMKLLSHAEKPIISGESAVAGIGVLLAAAKNPKLKVRVAFPTHNGAPWGAAPQQLMHPLTPPQAALGLNERSRVAIVICEAPPNPALFKKLTGETVESARARQAKA